MNPFKADFILAATEKKHFPQSDLPAVAFAGRSNVGKSSLINSLVLRKNLAHISSSPGKTQSINFYNVEDRWLLVDLPGYGYAQTAKTKRAEWSKLSSEFFTQTDYLAFVAVLVDSRHDPMDSDIAFIEWLENEEIPYLIILTKCDKISTKAVEERKAQIEGLTAYCNRVMEVLPYSAVTNIGREQLIGILKKASPKK